MPHNGLELKGDEHEDVHVRALDVAVLDLSWILDGVVGDLANQEVLVLLGGPPLHQCGMDEANVGKGSEVGVGQRQWSLPVAGKLAWRRGLVQWPGAVDMVGLWCLIWAPCHEPDGCGWGPHGHGSKVQVGQKCLAYSFLKFQPKFNRPCLQSYSWTQICINLIDSPT